MAGRLVHGIDIELPDGRDFAEGMRQYGELFRETPLTTFGAVLDQ